MLVNDLYTILCIIIFLYLDVFLFIIFQLLHCYSSWAWLPTYPTDIEILHIAYCYIVFGMYTYDLCKKK